MDSCTTCQTCQNGANLYLNYLFPERLIATKAQNYAMRYPKVAMIIEVFAAVILGLIKIFTIPIMIVSSSVLLLLQAAIKGCMCRGQEALSYLAAWGINLLVLALLVIMTQQSITQMCLLFIMGYFGKACPIP
ncbi:DUF5422 family protein [Chlamydia pecorum]|uniref:DUF5422 family protein n=1 Tax=Chlamydia pecorum TaxID=85991 RepID=UPI0012BD74C1|nr:DUF5422 family protein [Chlamydia pecorum]